ncbi:MAG: DUF6443 domain-containing protein, partial [Bacteroidales bacterium]
MKKIVLTISGLLVLMISNSQTFDYGYVDKIIPKDEVVDEAQLYSIPNMQTRTFFNGFGHKKQEIFFGQSSSLRDIVKFYKYDDFGRLSTDYLPYEDETQGYIVPEQTAITKQSSFYSNAFRVAHSQYPKSSVEFDGSPLNRINKSGNPGVWWQLDEHPVILNVTTNTSNEVKKFWLNMQNNTQWGWSEGTYYEVDMLYVKEVKDEDNQTEIQYIDILGRIVLAEVLMESGTRARTYFLYDNFSRLSLVISPEGSKIVDEWTTTQWLDEDFIDTWCYQYKYDERGRLTSKKIPGKAITNFIYDKFDRIRIIQDGNLAPDKWRFVKYDQLGRIVLTGLFQPQISKSLEDMRAYIENYADGITTFEFEQYCHISQTSPHGYTSQSAPNGGIEYEILIAYYYDSYEFATDAGIQNQYSEISGFNNSQAIKNRGQVTGSKRKILNGAYDYLYSVVFYNRKGNVIQEYFQNHLYKGFDQFTYSYNFTNDITKMHHLHGGVHNGIANTYVTDYRVEYDHAGRIKEIFHQFENQSEILMTSYEYNAIGQLVAKNLHSEDQGINFWQSIDYKYNIRGWLTKINDGNLGDDNGIIAMDESLSNLEMVSAIKIDSISYSLTLIEGRPGRNQIMIEITGIKTVKIAETENPENERETENNETEIIYLKEGSSDDYESFVTLYPLVGNTYYIDYDHLQYHDTLSALDYFTVIHNFNFNQLQAQTVKDSSQLILIDNMIVKHLMNSIGVSYLNESGDDLFGMDILYNYGPDGLDAPNLFNGNISGVLWRLKDDNHTRGYGYQYDRINRLIHAKYAERYEDGSWSINEDHYSVDIPGYDLNGNIDQLIRNRVDNDSPTVMDDLSYSYEGNKLIQANDAVTTGGVYNDFDDFGTTTPGIDEYYYDYNGNMIEDKNKGISIIYNHLDLPTEIYFGSMTDGNKLEYLYDAFGTKLKKRKYVWGNLESEIVYVGSFTYNMNGLQKVMTGEGTMEPNTNDGYDYHYFLTDHLGNVRIEFKKDENSGNLVTLQKNHYYPFGMKFDGFLNNSNKYLYNGKELQDDGFNLDGIPDTDRWLNWHDYGWRMQDPQLGRWHAIDPAAELYYSYSPHNYVRNNPINLYDVNGMYDDDGYDYDDEYYYGDPPGPQHAPYHSRDGGWGLDWNAIHEVVNNITGFFDEHILWSGFEDYDPYDDERQSYSNPFTIPNPGSVNFADKEERERYLDRVGFVSERNKKLANVVNATSELVGHGLPGYETAKGLAYLDQGDYNSAIYQLPWAIIEMASLNVVGSIRYGAAKASTKGFTYTKTAAKHFDDIVTKGANKGQLARPYMNSPLTIKEIMATGKGIPDAT